MITVVLLMMALPNIYGQDKEQKLKELRARRELLEKELSQSEAGKDMIDANKYSNNAAKYAEKGKNESAICNANKAFDGSECLETNQETEEEEDVWTVDWINVKHLINAIIKYNNDLKDFQEADGKHALSPDDETLLATRNRLAEVTNSSRSEVRRSGEKVINNTDKAELVGVVEGIIDNTSGQKGDMPVSAADINALKEIFKDCETCK